MKKPKEIIQRIKNDPQLLKINLAILALTLVVYLIASFALIKNTNNDVDNKYRTFLNSIQNSYSNAYFKDSVKLEDLMYNNHRIYYNDDEIFPRKTYILDENGNIVTESEPYVYFENTNDDSRTYIFLSEGFTDEIKNQYIEFTKKVDFTEVYKVEYNIVDGKNIATKVYLLDTNHLNRTTTLVLNDTKAEYVLEETGYPDIYFEVDDDLSEDDDLTDDHYFSEYNFFIYNNYNDKIYQNLIDEFYSKDKESYIKEAHNIESYIYPNTIDVIVNVVEIGDKSYVAVDLTDADFFRETVHKFFWDLNWLGLLTWFMIISSWIIRVVDDNYEKSKRLKNARLAFTSAAAHELKTPLSIIQNQCECVIEDVAPEKNKEYVQSVCDEAVRMNELVNTMLKYNRLSSVDSIEKERFNLSELVREEAEKYEPMAESRGIRMICNVQPDLYIKANRELIALAVDNYISNAIKYLDGGTYITVKLNKEKYTELVVYNACKGISYRDSPHLWDILYRNDRARTSSQGSTGMGLPICKQIFDLHGYKYGYINKPNGVEFYFKTKK